MKILAINPGMISTKIGVFIDEEIVMHACINHPFDELCRYPFIMDEFDYRKESIVKELELRRHRGARRTDKTHRERCL